MKDQVSLKEIFKCNAIERAIKVDKLEKMWFTLEINLYGCLFHFTKAIWRNAVNQGLKVPCNARVRHSEKSVGGLRAKQLQQCIK